MIVSILVDVIVTTCNKNSLATSQSLNRTQSAPRKSCFASTEVCPKGSFLFGTLKFTLHFMTFCSATCHIPLPKYFQHYFSTAFPSVSKKPPAVSAVASRRRPPRSRRPRASGDVVAQSSGAARERRSGPPLKPPGEVPRGKWSAGRHGLQRWKASSPWCDPNPSNTRPAVTFHPMHWDVLVPESAQSTQYQGIMDRWERF